MTWNSTTALKKRFEDEGKRAQQRDMNWYSKPPSLVFWLGPRGAKTAAVAVIWTDAECVDEWQCLYLNMFMFLIVWKRVSVGTKLSVVYMFCVSNHYY